jgi:outer membrane protein assembly factor BamB
MLLGSLLAASTAQADQWRQQGGPGRNGIVQAQRLNMAWDAETAPVKWRANAGFGSSPVVVADGRVYTFGAYKVGAEATALDEPGAVPTSDDLRRRAATTYAEAIALYPEGGAGNVQTLSRLKEGSEKWRKEMATKRFYHAWEYVQCFDAGSGERLWATCISKRLLLSANHVQWGLSSPLLADGGLFIHDPNGQLFRLDPRDGAIQWHVNLFEAGMESFHDKQANASGPVFFDGNVIVQYNTRAMTVSAFNARTGQQTWKHTFPANAFRSHFSRLGLAQIGGAATLLVPAGWATAGLNPSTGEVRWELDVYTASREWKQEAYKEIEQAYKAGRTPGRNKPPDDGQLTRGYACYTSYAPVAWEDYVIDYRDYAHSDFVSSTYCLKVGKPGPRIVWQTNNYVPEAYPDKSNMIARDGRLYFFEFSDQSYIPRIEVGRLGRPKGTGQFVCLDIPTGKLLWSTDAFRVRPSAKDEYVDDRNGYKFILAGDQIVANADCGLWLGIVGQDGAEAKVAITWRSSKFGVPNLPAEPVLVDRMLYFRQTMPQQGQGILAEIGGAGNLICLDLSLKDAE